MRDGSVPGVVIVEQTRAMRGVGRLGSCAAVLALGAIGVSGCNSSGDASTTTPTSAEPATTTTASPPETPSPTTTSPTTSPSTTTPTTEPAPVPIEPVIEGLIGRYDSAVEAILLEPSVTRDQTSDEVAEYLDLFVADSSFALGAISAWQADAEQGRSYRSGGDGPIIESRLVEVLDESASSVSFHVCTASNFEVIDASGVVTESQAGVAGVRGVVVLENEEWRLRDLTQEPSLECSEVRT